MTEKKVSLLPCPFCGGEARWVEVTDALDTPFGLVTEHDEACFLGSRMMAEWDNIVTAWNTRHSSEEGRLREALELMCRRADAVQDVSGGTVQHSDLLVATIAARTALSGIAHD